jgi:hypothetical protein
VRSEGHTTLIFCALSHGYRLSWPSLAQRHSCWSHVCADAPIRLSEGNFSNSRLRPHLYGTIRRRRTRRTNGRRWRWLQAAKLILASTPPSAGADWPLPLQCSLHIACRETARDTRHLKYVSASSPPPPLTAVSCTASRRGSARPMSAKAGARPIMPRPGFPPTPAPSTDIVGKSSVNASQLDGSFTLPPAAINGGGSNSTDVSSGASTASDSSYRPPSPASPAATTKVAPASRKRASTTQSSIITKNDYSLPPPPTRSRKIIQMKPKEEQEQPKTTSPTQTAKAAPPAAAAGGKRKQSSGTTAAGRKIARKTAHSLIERRRRSKMNEEFGVLKDMIPACEGQEMHKLAILQVSFWSIHPRTRD